MHKIVVSLALASLLIQANAQELNMEKLLNTFLLLWASLIGTPRHLKKIER